MPRFKLARISERCERIMVRSPYANYPIGTVCRTADGWTYSYVGPSPSTVHGPVSTKQLALRKAVKGYTTWIG